MEDNSFYISLKSALKDKLIKNLIKDEDFKGLNIEELIKRTVEEKLDSDIDFSNISKSKTIDETSEKYIIKEAMKMNKNIEFIQENHKNKDSTAYDRYENYKCAKNYKEFIELCGDNGDYYNDYRKGYLKILD